jgi:TRAP-type C4-dicarboxylate transport system substrate-binding protein
MGKRTNGALKAEIYWAGALAKAQETPDAIRTGLADLGMLPLMYRPSDFALSSVGVLPAVTGSHLTNLLAVHELVETVPQITEKEIGQFNAKFLGTWSAGYEVLSVKPVRTVDDLKGKKIGIFGKQFPVLFERLGAVPVALKSVEVYEALARGTIDARIGDAELVYRYKWYESAHYLTKFGVGALALSYWVMNMDTWNKLSPDIQATLLQLFKDTERKLDATYKANEAKQVQEMEKAVGFEVIVPSPEERAEFRAAAQAIWDDYAADLESKGLPGKQVVATYLKLIEKYSR